MVYSKSVLLNDSFVKPKITVIVLHYNDKMNKNMLSNVLGNCDTLPLKSTVAIWFSTD